MADTPRYKILVTGGAGFIGSHIADALLSEGHEVHILDNLSTGKRENIPDEAVFHEMDIRDSAIADLWAKFRFEILVHEAAQMDVRKSVADPVYDAGVNVLGFLNLMEAGRKNGLQKVVFASTGGAIYGEPEGGKPQSESHPEYPVSPYGVTKLTTERYLHYYQVQYGLSYVALRYANVYGPRQNPHGEAGVVSIFCRRLLTGTQAFIHGDGLQTRDYVYVGDVVQMNLHAVSHSGSGVFNVGTGIETTVVDLFHTIRRAAGARAKQEFKPGLPGEQRRSVLDASRAASMFGWVPANDLETGIAKTVDWFKNNSS